MERIWPFEAIDEEEEEDDDYDHSVEVVVASCWSATSITYDVGQWALVSTTLFCNLMSLMLFYQFESSNG